MMKILASKDIHHRSQIQTGENRSREDQALRLVVRRESKTIKMMMKKKMIENCELITILGLNCLKLINEIKKIIINNFKLT